MNPTLKSFQNYNPTYYYGYDGHGSVRFLLDPSGTITDTYTYDAFGVLITQTPSALTDRIANNYLYCGEQYDPDLGLYYNRARYLNPNTGRFWTMDAFEGRPPELLSLHKYAYAHNNPINGWDPSGHSFILEYSIAAAKRGAIAGGTLGSVSAGFTYARTKSISAAVTAGATTAVMAFGSAVSPLALYSFGFGGTAAFGLNVWAEGLSKSEAYEMATLFAVSLALHSPAPRWGPRFKNVYPEDVPVTPLRQFGPGEVKGTAKLNYVVTTEGELKLGKISEAPGGGHIDLAEGKPVLAAGQADFVDGRLIGFNNHSAHYRPNGPFAAFFATKAMTFYGLDAVGKYHPTRFDFSRQPIKIPFDQVFLNTGAAVGVDENE